jgi:hypothetical protein
MEVQPRWRLAERHCELLIRSWFLGQQTQDAQPEWVRHRTKLIDGF